MKPPAPRRTIRLVAAVFLGSLFTLALTASAASAGTTSPSSALTAATANQSGLICGTQATSPSPATNNLLPINRWAGAIGEEHTRLSSGLLSSVTNAPDTIDRTVFVGGMTSVGASEWELGSTAVDAATSFCFAQTVGTTANTLAADLGNALLNANILAYLAIFAVITAAWKASRGRQNPFRYLISFALLSSLFAMMVTSATNSTATDALPLSPAWMVESVFNAVSNVAGVTSTAMSSAANATVGGSTQESIAKQDPLSCYWYTGELVDQYNTAANAGGADTSVVPDSLNALWEQAAIPSYVDEQFGSSNNYGDLIYCHLLDQQAGVSPAEQMQVALDSGTLSGDVGLASFREGNVTGAGSSAGTQASALAWNGALTNDQQDESLVAWAACQSSDKGSGGSGFTPSEWDFSTGKMITSEWATVQNTVPISGNGQSIDSTVAGKDCQVFWAANAPASGGQFGDGVNGGPFSNPSQAPWPGNISNPDLSVFNWSNSTQAVASATNSQSASGIANFISNLHGTSNGGAETAAMVWLLTSTLVMLVFLILAGAAFLAKIALLLAICILPIMLIFSMTPNGAGKLGQFAKHLFGLTLFAAATGLLLSLVATFSGIIADIGVSAFGTGIFSIFWVGLSPILAVYAIHRLFKMAKMPSPFRPTAGMAMASALSGVGGGVAGADLFQHLSRRGSQLGYMARRRMTDSKGRPNSGPGRGHHSMGRNGRPSSGGGVGAGGVGAGVAAGVGAATASVDQSMGRKRSARRFETDRYKADQFARQERVSGRAKRLAHAKGSLLGQERGSIPESGDLRDSQQSRLQASIERSRDRFNNVQGDKKHRVQGSILSAGAAAGALGAGVRRVPRVAKYGALGLAGAGLVGAGAIPLGIGAAAYGAHRLRKHARSAPLRSEQRMVSYQNHVAEQDRLDQVRKAQAVKKTQDESDAAEARAKMTSAERQAHDEGQRRDREAAARRDQQSREDETARLQREEAWRRGDIGRPGAGPRGTKKEGPFGPR